MSRQEERSIKLYDGKAYGHKVSDYALENGYLDYHTLSKIVGDMVLINYMMQYMGSLGWELVSGNDIDEEGEYYEIYQWYVIAEHGAQFLEEHTDEIVYYHEEMDMYVWGITHFGTSWDYVLTDIKLQRS
jgi:hypothetical protein